MLIENTELLDLDQIIKANNINAKIIDIGLDAKTSEIAANKLGVAVGNIFKTIILRYKKTKKDREYVAVVLPGDKDINLVKVCEELGWSKNKVSFANSEAALEITGYPPGGTPPFGFKNQIPIILAKSLFDYAKGYGGGGRYNLIVEITPQELLKVTQGALLEMR